MRVVLNFLIAVNTVLMVMVVNVSSASAKEEMIQFDPENAMVTEFTDKDGNPIMVQPVQVLRDENQQVVAIRPVSHNWYPGVPNEGDEVTPVGTLQLGIPQGLSASLGMIVGKTECKDATFIGMCSHSGILFEATAGFLGGQLSIGVANQTFLAILLPIIVSANMKLSYLRSWWDGTEYLGIQGDASFEFLKFSIGVLSKISDRLPGAPVLPIVGFGLGF